MANKYIHSFSPEKEASCEDASDSLELIQLQSQIDKALGNLPQKTQEIFRMSRDEHKSAKDIASILSLSTKSVEYHITKTIKYIKKYLKNSLGIF